MVAQISELERMSQLRPFLPRHLAEMVVNSGDDKLLKSHRREISVVFCDLRGFSSFAEVAEPEDVMAVLASYHAAAGPLIERYEGTLERFIGDGLMILFNDPLPCSDPALCAIRLALDLRESIEVLMAKWRARG